MICRACKADKPDTREFWYHRDGKPDGHLCKLCKRGHDKLIPICHHCGEPIQGADPQTHYHRDDKHPDCQQAHRLNHLHAMRQWDRENRGKRKEGLSACKAKKQRGRVAKDVMEMYGHLDGDWIYA